MKIRKYSTKYAKNREIQDDTGHKLKNRNANIEPSMDPKKRFYRNFNVKTHMYNATYLKSCNTTLKILA